MRLVGRVPSDDAITVKKLVAWTRMNSIIIISSTLLTASLPNARGAIQTIRQPHAVTASGSADNRRLHGELGDVPIADGRADFSMMNPARWSR